MLAATNHANSVLLCKGNTEDFVWLFFATTAEDFADNTLTQVFEGIAIEKQSRYTSIIHVPAK